MLINPEIRKCVVFIAYRTADGKFHTCGTAFFLGKEVPGTQTTNPTFLITAKHVINGIRGLGLDSVWLRHNVKNGDDAWYETKLEKWYCDHPDQSIDVAVIEMGVLDIFDNLVFPYGLCLNEEKFKEHQVGPGDEVFITGLFKHHQGKKKSIPIIRTGTIACLSEEKVFTKNFGEIDAFLIEARSIGGLSGSPVFVNLGLSRFIDGQIKQSNGGAIYFFLGLIHGHFDVDDSEFTEQPNVDPETRTIEKINSGIAIVVPFQNIDKVITEYQNSKTTIT
jgi:hypothetical protein